MRQNNIITINYMRKKLLRLSLAFLVSVMPALPMLAQIPEGYYSSLKGKKGAEKETAKAVSFQRQRAAQCWENL